MERDFNEIKRNVYDKCNFNISNFQFESESKEYEACRFELNELKIISRNAKITPKKIGQFVTFWKRNRDGIIEPFDLADEIDFYIVNVWSENKFGQFVFPKLVLIDNGIISTEKKEGKRGFRVYPSWDLAQNKQALRTQKWQLNYFYEINEMLDLERIKCLYS